MKFCLSLIFSFVCAAGAAAQMPPVGIIDFYGLRTIAPARARAVLEIREGDAAPASRKEITTLEARLASLPNVAAAQVTLVCCDDAEGRSMLYVGIREKGRAALRFRAAPRGLIRLPAEIVRAGEEFEAALVAAIGKGETQEDDSPGHALMANAAARAVQERFVTFAARRLPLLKKVLRSSGDAAHRALAAQIVAYAPDKRAIVADLVAAAADADETVRNNAIRALAVLARYAQTAPEKRIAVPLAPFVRLLDSLSWSDRNKASFVLLSLTQKRDAPTLAALRRAALPALVEMARWRNPGHAFAPLFVLGRILGLPDEEIERLRSAGKGGEIIERAARRAK